MKYVPHINVLAATKFKYKCPLALSTSYENKVGLIFQSVTFSVKKFKDSSPSKDLGPKVNCYQLK